MEELPIHFIELEKGLAKGIGSGLVKDLADG